MKSAAGDGGLCTKIEPKNSVQLSCFLAYIRFVLITKNLVKLLYEQIYVDYDIPGPTYAPPDVSFEVNLKSKNFCW